MQLLAERCCLRVENGAPYFYMLSALALLLTSILPGTTWFLAHLLLLGDVCCCCLRYAGYHAALATDWPHLAQVLQDGGAQLQRI
jgi:hypothetical protein